MTDKWLTVITAWTTYLEAAGTSPNTIRTRREHMQRFARTARAVSPGAVTGDALVRWFAKQDWASETRRSHRNTHRAFWAWALDAGHCDVNPAEALPTVKAVEGIPRPIPEHLYREALREAPERVRLILRLAAEVGLRRAEIAQVHERDLVRDLQGVSLIVHGKGNRSRLIPLPPRLGVEVEAACSARGYLLPGEYRGHLSPRYVGKLAARALPRPWTLHTLRHRFATRAYSLDRDVFTVQQLLGHASPATTRRYVALDTSRLRATVEKIAA